MLQPAARHRVARLVLLAACAVAGAPERRATSVDGPASTGEAVDGVTETTHITESTAAATTQPQRGGGGSKPFGILLAVLDDFGVENVQGVYGGAQQFCYKYNCGSASFYSQDGRPANETLTPNIERLMTEGTTFTKFYAMPQCAVSRATLLSGRYPFAHNVTDKDAVMAYNTSTSCRLGGTMQAAGYRTLISGRFHFRQFLTPGDIQGRCGFDEYYLKAEAEPRYKNHVITSSRPGADANFTVP